MEGYSEIVDKAREYYNSNDADKFYMMTWGGEDIHIGMYQSEQDSIYTASRRTVEYMSSLLSEPCPGAQSTILDIGSGYGGASRYLAAKFGCQVTSLNLSENQNIHNRMVNKKNGLDHLVDVVDGSFENIPFPDRSFDVVWSQDAILHSGNRARVIDEVARVLKEGGVFIFTDIMQSSDCPEGVLQPILDRIHLQSLASPVFYKETSRLCNLEEVRFEDLTYNLICHYDQVLQETKNQEQELKGHISATYIENMKTGLRHWVEGGKNGYLTWGVFMFRKRRANTYRKRPKFGAKLNPEVSRT